VALDREGVVLDKGGVALEKVGFIRPVQGYSTLTLFEVHVALLGGGGGGGATPPHGGENWVLLGIIDDSTSKEKRISFSDGWCWSLPPPPPKQCYMHFKES